MSTSNDHKNTEIKNTVPFTASQKVEILRYKSNKHIQELYAENHKPLIKGI